MVCLALAVFVVAFYCLCFGLFVSCLVWLLGLV